MSVPQNIVSVISGGWSFNEVDHSKVPGRVIAVNDSAKYFQGRVDDVVSMDRLWSEARWDWLYKTRSEFCTAFIRKAALKRLPWQEQENEHWLVPFDNELSPVFSPNSGTLNGTNSGYCGLNLAYCYIPDVIYLFGFDMQLGPRGERHWHPRYEWGPPDKSASGYKFPTWAEEFRIARKQFDKSGIKVVNVSSRTLIKAFDVLTPKELQWAK